MRKNIFDNDKIWEWVDTNDENRVRFEFTERLTPGDVTKVIDVGCGHGGFLKVISNIRKHVEYVAVDNSPGALQHIPFEKALASITSVPYNDGQFDCAYALEVLEHLNPEDFGRALRELARLSKKYIIISVPYREDIESNMVRCPHCFTKFHYDGHLQSFDDEKIRSLFENDGFACRQVERLGWVEKFKYHKLYVKLFFPSQRYTTPHYTVCPACDSELKPGTAQTAAKQVKTKRFSLGQAVKRPLKWVWPKEKISYWIVGLYEKK